MLKKILLFAFLFICSITFVNALELEENLVLDNDLVLNEQLIIPEEKTIVIDLNDKTLTASSSGVRKIINRGNLTIKNGTILNDNNSAYGIIDNYGVINIHDVVFNDAGCGDGSTLKNRGGSITVRDSVFNNTGINSGNAGIYSDGNLTVIDTIFSSSSTGAYPLVVNSGLASISGATVTGSKGGMAVNSGIVTIMSGTYTGETYYGIWITNNGETDVTIRNGKFYGKRYGLYAAVDDGLQDVGDVGIKILSGFFEGEIESVALLNDDKSDKSWGMDIIGGIFTTSVSKYVKGKYREYTSDNTFIVAPELTTEIENGKYLELGVNSPLNILFLNYLGEIINTSNLPITYSIEDENIAKINNYGITGLLLGKTNLIINLNDGREAQKHEIIVYALKDETDSNKIQTTENFKNTIASLLESILSNDTDIKGISHESIEIIKSSILLGEEISTELSLTEASDEENTQYKDKINNIMPNGYNTLNSYDIELRINANDNYIANINETTSDIKITIPINNDVNPNYERVFNVIRIHNDTTEILDATYNDGYLTFNTNQFSYYQVIYKDTLKTILDDVPKTGDYSLYIILITLLTVFVVGIFWYYKMLGYEKE